MPSVARGGEIVMGFDGLDSELGFLIMPERLRTADKDDVEM